MHIAHRNTYYWKIQSDPGSVYGRIASLNAVCRFLMYGYINAVPPGRYKVQWRMRVGIDSRINGNFKFSVSLEQIFNSSSFIYETYDMPEEFYLDPHIKGRGWVVLTMPGIVTVNPKVGYSNIYFCQENISYSWKSGLDFDWVRLVSASNTSKCNNSRMYVKKDNDNIMVQVENDSMIGKPYYTKAEKRVSVELKKHIRNLTTKLRRIFQNTQA
ncbi:hypothetical protein CLU79DRAFT_95025 [Phycomyces nitens]|nr:hypothetical protein CLU79DRAFT_95025 [Phycomyces nitens]